MGRILALLVATLTLASCEQRGSTGAPKQGDALDRLAAQAAPPKEYSCQRFIPVPRQPENVTGVPWSGAFALDTQTGQLCRTYNGNLPEAWMALPMCVDLAKDQSGPKVKILSVTPVEPGK